MPAPSSRDDIPTNALMSIGGVWREGETRIDIRDPYRGDVVGTMPISTADDLDDALNAARRGAETMAALPGFERAALLRRIADRVEDRAENFGRVMARESGKSLSDCQVEVRRSADTLRLAAEEAVRIEGEHIPMDASAIGAGKIAMTLRFPVGVVAAITPFNAPVNLAAHKIGPALAAGNSIVIKPSPKAPLSLHLLIDAAMDAGVPSGAVNVLYGDEVAPQLIHDPRVDFVSFTGSIPVGKIIKSNVGMKRVALELGGVGPTFVHPDADITNAAKACARNGLLLAGQSCISVQNVYVHNAVYDEFIEGLLAEADTIRYDDPLKEETDVGTLIDKEAALRVTKMIERAIDKGATALRAGTRDGAQLTGTILTNVNEDMDLVSDEVFGPALSVQTFENVEPIIKRINNSPYGLQCGIYTNSLDVAMNSLRSLRTGGVILNGTSRWRSDQMPYGGVKDSGIGREGPKFAIREMTEERLFVINQ